MIIKVILKKQKEQQMIKLLITLILITFVNAEKITKEDEYFTTLCELEEKISIRYEDDKWVLNDSWALGKQVIRKLDTSIKKYGTSKCKDIPESYDEPGSYKVTYGCYNIAVTPKAKIDAFFTEVCEEMWYYYHNSKRDKYLKKVVCAEATFDPNGKFMQTRRPSLYFIPELRVGKCTRQ